VKRKVVIGRIGNKGSRLTLTKFQRVMEGGWIEGRGDICLGLRGYNYDHEDIYLGRMSVISR
jgi:hypothetical protein